MSKKIYNGLEIRYVSTEGSNIITASACEEVSVQYYIVKGGLGQCDTEMQPSEDFDVGYSINWNNSPFGMP